MSNCQYKHEVESVVDNFKQYVTTYKTKDSGYKGNIFVDDMLYGIGLAINPIKYGGALGYTEFKNLLLRKLFYGDRIYFEGEDK